ncbi:MAG TPA: hypothetical protein PL033_12330 [Candidatus Brocadiia bacterium]|nr:hypothetical protein [Candidatus Brocadiia bacterium]
MRKKIHVRNAGFTLKEAIIVAAVVLSSLAIIVHSAYSARRSARNSKCLSNMKQIGVAVNLYSSQNDASPPFALTARMNSWKPLRTSREQEGAFELYGGPYLLGACNRLQTIWETTGGDSSAQCAWDYISAVMMMSPRQQMFPFIIGCPDRVKVYPDGTVRPSSSDNTIFHCPSDSDWSSGFDHPFQSGGKGMSEDLSGFGELCKQSGIKPDMDSEVLRHIESSYFFASSSWSGQMAGDMTGLAASEEVLRWIRDNGGKWDRDALFEAMADPDRPLGEWELFQIKLMPPGKQGSNGTTRPLEDEKDDLYPTARGETRVGIKRSARKPMFAEFGKVRYHKQGKMAKHYDWDDPADPAKSARTEGWHGRNRTNVLFADGHAETVEGGWWNKYPPMAGPCCLPIGGGRGNVDARDLYFPTHWKQFDATGGSEEAFVNYACYNENVK